MAKMRVKRAANGYRIGDSHHNSRLLDHEIETARRMRDAGSTLDEVSDALGITRGYASKLTRFKARHALTELEVKALCSLLAAGKSPQDVAAAMRVPVEQVQALQAARGADEARTLDAAMRGLVQGG